MSLSAAFKFQIVAGSPGQIYVTDNTPSANWTSLISYDIIHGRFTSGGSGSDRKTTIGPLVGSETTASALYFLGNGISPTATNYSIYGDATTIYYNAPSGIHNFYNANSLIAQFSSSSLQLSTQTQILWAASVLSPSITQTKASSGAGQTMSITAQAAATGSNANGGNLQLQGGSKDGSGLDGYVVFPKLAGLGSGYATLSNAGAVGFSTTVSSSGIAPGTAGQIFVTNSTPASSWTSLINYETVHGRLTSGGGGGGGGGYGSAGGGLGAAGGGGDSGKLIMYWYE